MSAITLKNSTNVRAWPVFRVLARAYFSMVSRVAPGLASRQVERMFTTPPAYAGRKEPASNARRHTVRSGRHNLAIWEAGAAGAPAVLLVHGWGGRSVQMETFVAPLRDRGFRVVWFDLPGH